MKKLLFIILLLPSIVIIAQQKHSFKKDKKLLHQIENNFKDASLQYQYLMKNIPTNKFPKTYYDSIQKYEWSNSGWWCSGFYPGTLQLIYQQTNNTVLYTESKRMLDVLKKEQFNTSTHDLGFMMYCSFGNALKIKPTNEYSQILLNSAKSLATRFDTTVGCIKSWNGKPNEFLVIIDNMMNLKLLFWATQFTGDSTYYKIATTHANTTLKNHFRQNKSSYHVINYNATDGTVIQKKTAQGFNNESAWARGQTWGLYGYTETYRETKDIKYLNQANAIANFILKHPNFPKDKIPYWDFDASNIPNALKDASAAAVMASALIELSIYVKKAKAKKYMKVAEEILKSLSTSTYKATLNTNGGFLLKHSVGHNPKAEVDVPLTYADYYFVEAMIRYKNVMTKNSATFN